MIDVAPAATRSDGAVIRFSVITDSPGFRALEADWRALCERASPHSFFNLFDWQWRAWQHVASARKCCLRILVGRVDERIVLIWPFVLDGRLIRFLCSEKFEYRDVLVEQGPRAASWIMAAWRYVRRLPGGDVLELRNIPASSSLCGLLDEKIPYVLRRDESSPVIQLDRFSEWAAYAASLPKRLVADQERQWRRLHALPGGPQFHVVSDAAEIDVLVDWIFTHKLAWAAQRCIETGVYPTVAYRNFIKSAVHDGLASGNLLLCRLSAAGEILSAGFGFVHGTKFVFYMFAYDAAYATFSPSRLLMERIIRRCMELGLTRFDFLPGPEHYKWVWADTSEGVVDYLIPVTLLGHGRMFSSRYLLALLSSQRWLAPCFRAIPAFLRRLAWRRLAAEIYRTTEMQPIPRKTSAMAVAVTAADQRRTGRR
jgi:CelD/BcsL family acetyltransferase involved in cellulose biosynthesis